MSEVEIHDGTIDIDASIVARGLELEPSSVHAMMRKGEITSLCEGTVMRRSIINFGDRPLPVSMPALDT